jgi:hypothetical protein
MTPQQESKNAMIQEIHADSIKIHEIVRMLREAGPQATEGIMINLVEMDAIEIIHNKLKYE